MYLFLQFSPHHHPSVGFSFLRIIQHECLLFVHLFSPAVHYLEFCTNSFKSILKCDAAYYWIELIDDNNNKGYFYYFSTRNSGSHNPMQSFVIILPLLASSQKPITVVCFILSDNPSFLFVLAGVQFDSEAAEEEMCLCGVAAQ